MWVNGGQVFLWKKCVFAFTLICTACHKNNEHRHDEQKTECYCRMRPRRVACWTAMIDSFGIREEISISWRRGESGERANLVNRDLLISSFSVYERAFPGFWGNFFGYSTPFKRSVLVHKNSFASCQRCRHSVEPHTLTCPFKQSNLSAWSPLSWHPTHYTFEGDSI